MMPYALYKSVTPTFTVIPCEENKSYEKKINMITLLYTLSLLCNCFMKMLYNTSVFLDLSLSPFQYVN